MRSTAPWSFVFLCLFFFASGVSSQQGNFGYHASQANDPSQIAFNIHYQLNKADPSRIDSISFTLHPAMFALVSEMVRAQLISGSDSWYTCRLHESIWSCETGDHPLLTAIDQVQVKTQP